MPPPFYWGQIYEAKHHPGTLTLPPSLLLDLMLHTLDEIGRNGFEKIIIVNGHGGNNYLQEFLAQCVLDRERPYTLYLQDFFFTGEAEKFAASYNPNRPLDFGHGGEIETALVMVNAPETVKLEYETGENSPAVGRRIIHFHSPVAYSGLFTAATPFFRHYPVTRNTTSTRTPSGTSKGLA